MLGYQSGCASPECEELTILWNDDCGASPVEDDFYAVVDGDGAIILRWAVEALPSVEGLNVYRTSDSADAPVLLNDEPIPVAATGSYLDTTVWPETTFWYQLRAILAGGTEETVVAGPISVTTVGELVLVLRSARPNPFTGETTVSFDIPGNSARASLNVYDVSGRLVTRLVVPPVERGRHSVSWDGRDTNGESVSSGVYFMRLSVDDRIRASKVLLLR
jgi:hypothetical protein